MEMAEEQAKQEEQILKYDTQTHTQPHGNKVICRTIQPAIFRLQEKIGDRRTEELQTYSNEQTEKSKGWVHTSV